MIKLIDWGNGMKVSQLCFGSLVMGPLQKDMPPQDGGRLIREALEMGVNFIDTAQGYKNYEHIRLGLAGWNGKVYLATKSHAKDYEEMEKAIHQALKELQVEYIDIFHLHAARTDDRVFEEKQGALECLCEYRSRGVIGRVGIATHAVLAVARAAEEACIDVIFPLINLAGLGIIEGNKRDMEKAIKKAHLAGKRLYAMKIYGGGNLLEDRKAALDYVLALPGIDVVAIGMVTRNELLVNIGLLKGSVAPKLLAATKGDTKTLTIRRFCKGCGNCIEHCPNGALRLDGGVCKVDRDRCILCGYCAPHCPEFAIRVV